MALATYANLLTAVDGWLNRSGSLNTQIPDFIALAEAEFNRRLRTPDMETSASATITTGVAPLPTDSLGVRDVIYADVKLDAVTYQDMLGMYQNQAGTPTLYAVSDGDLYFLPKPASGSATVVYYQKIPALTVSNTTNWLMTRFPDLYLFGTLMQAEFYGWNDDRLPLIKARVEELFEQITADGIKRKHGAGPLVARLRNSPSVHRTIRA
jgi:hypothetical protein